MSWSNVVHTRATKNQLMNAVHGALRAYDLPDLVAGLAPQAVRLDGLVDGLNRRVPAEAAGQLYRPAADAHRRAGGELVLGDDPATAATWLAALLK